MIGGLVTPAVAAAALLGGLAVANQPAFSGAGAAIGGHRDGVVLRAEVAAGIRPGTSRPVRLTASNPGSAAVRVRQVRLNGVTADDRHPGCVTTDFTMADIPQQVTVPAGAQDHELADGALVYAETGVDQSACIGARLTLRFAIR
jgi:hypothetical protein